MLNDARIVESIFFDFPLRDIMRRLGGSAENPDQVALAEPVARQFYEHVRPRGAYATLEIVANDGHTVVFADGSRIDSVSIARFCSGASRVWLGAVTLGNAASARIEAAFASQNASQALILDAAASECADAALQSLQVLAQNELRRQGLALSSSRFSCGYGDWKLADQSLYFKWLPMTDLGITLTDGGIMIPEKSVTALAKC